MGDIVVLKDRIDRLIEMREFNQLVAWVRLKKKPMVDEWTNYLNGLGFTDHEVIAALAEVDRRLKEETK